MALNIKNPEVERMARELARRRKMGITEAVQEALNQALADSRSAPSEEQKFSRLMEDIRRIQDAVAALPILDPRSMHEIRADLYDEDGVPK